MAIPLQKGQISCRELMLGKYGHRMIADCKKDVALSIDHIDTPYSEDSKLRALIHERGI
jgi:N-acetylneuraminate synthase